MSYIQENVKCLDYINRIILLRKFDPPRSGR